MTPLFSFGDWTFVKNDRFPNYIIFAYTGAEAEQSEVAIYYGPETWREGVIKVDNIVPISKQQLTIEEYNAVLDLFYTDVIAPNIGRIHNLKVVGPESDVFDPLRYISQSALNKLELFCNNANKTTGSAHPLDEERWFDFICQTFDDKQVFDYETLYRFLSDEEYWGKKNKDNLGVMGRYAWDSEHASELAEEYDNYVRILEYYKNKKWKEDYEASQT